jgi:putative flippase GtrA
MSLFRQGSHFILVGVLQLVVDWAVFVALSALGLGVAPANLFGRVSGACLGYWLNGRITFAVNGEARLGGRRFLRFATVWLALTAVSTLLVAGLAAQLGLAYAWLAKPLVESGLAALSFVIARLWIYR